jgi:hypothetical protein
MAEFRKKKKSEHKTCVLIFSTTFVWNTSHSKRNSASYSHTCTQVSMSSTRYSCQILTELQSCRQIFEEHSNIKFREKTSRASWVAPRGGGGAGGRAGGRTDGRTDGHDEAKSRAPQFCDTPKHGMTIMYSGSPTYHETARSDNGQATWRGQRTVPSLNCTNRSRGPSSLACLSLGNRYSFPGCKATEIKNEWSFTSMHSSWRM